MRIVPFRSSQRLLPVALALTFFCTAAAQEPAPDDPPAIQPLPSAAETAELFEITPLDKITLDPRPLGHPAPPDVSEEVLPERDLADLRELRMEQGWTNSQLHWRATNFWHHPLYFEDVLLERHGQYCRWLQPGWSAAHFFASAGTLPYKALLERPCEKVYTLGFGRPGSCKPPMNRMLPLQVDAATLETAAVIGVIGLVP